MEFKGVLTIEIIEAKHLIAADKSGTSDPYVVVTVGKQNQKTKVIDKTLNPQWNQTLTFYTTSTQWKEDIKLKVFDSDAYSAHDPLGEYTIAAQSDLAEGAQVEGWNKLQKIKTGEIHTRVSFRLLKEDEEVRLEMAEDEEDAELKVKQKGETYWPLKGSVYPPSEWKATADTTKLPTQSLELEFVYSYRGHDCRDNLHFGADGKLIYNAASIGVVFDTANRTQSFYKGHNDDVVSLAVHPNGEIVATGQVATLKGVRKPRICVWNAKTKETLSDISGFHERSVVALGFSPNGEYLVSVGTDDHNSIALYSWKTKAIVASAYGSSNKVLCSRFVPGNNNAFVTSGVKHIKFWTLENGKISAKEGVFKKLPIQTIVSIEFTPQGHIVTGTYSGEVYVWKDAEAVKSIKAHEGPVYAVLYTPAGLLTGGKDGKVVLHSLGDDLEAKVEHTFDLNAQRKHGAESFSVRSLAFRDGKIVAGTSDNSLFEILLDSKEVKTLLVGHAGDTQALATNPHSDEFVTGGNEKAVQIYSTTEKRFQRATVADGPVASAGYSSNGKLLAVGSENGSVIIFDSHTLERVHTFNEKTVKVDAVEFSPQGDLLAIGYHDGSLEIHLTSDWKKITSLKGQSSYISHLDWSVDGKVIQTDSGAYEHLFWDVEDAQQITRSTAVRNLEWNTYHCILGWHVKGIWPKGADGTDINALARSRTSKNFLATADDNGLVKLFRFPAIEGSKWREYSGHSSHVANVRFTYNDSHLISCGGNDKTIFQWKVNGVSEAERLAAENVVVDEPVVVHVPSSPTLTVEEGDALKAQLTELAAKLTQANNEKKLQEKRIHDLEHEVNELKKHTANGHSHPAPAHETSANNNAPTTHSDHHVMDTVLSLLKAIQEDGKKSLDTVIHSIGELKGSFTSASQPSQPIAHSSSQSEVTSATPEPTTESESKPDVPKTPEAEKKAPAKAPAKTPTKAATKDTKAPAKTPTKATTPAKKGATPVKK